MNTYFYTEPNTGEIQEIGPTNEKWPPMPPEIAGAIFAVMRKAKRLGTDEKNEHGNYEYVSIDKFLEEFRPIMAEAGLGMLINEIEVENQQSSKDVTWAFSKYDLWLFHESGKMWGPIRRHVGLPLNGPQAYGAAASYVQKVFLRALFMVATGDKDADEIAQSTDAPSRATRHSPSVASPSAEQQAAAKFIRDAIDMAPDVAALHRICNADGWNEDIRKYVDTLNPTTLDFLKTRFRVKLERMSNA